MLRDEKILFGLCERYLLEEPSEKLRSEIRYLMSSTSVDAMHEMRDRLSQDLMFGTAGLRGKMEAGYNRMNAVSVYRFAHSFGVLLINDISKDRNVVVGFDGRHHSHDFANLVSSVLRSMGITVHLFRACIPTPLCAYAAKALGASMSIMVTASHNPAWDNGIKLFSASSAQVHGQLLHDIEAHRNEAPLYNEFVDGIMKNCGDENLHFIGDEIAKQYLRDIKSTRFFPDADASSGRLVKIAYTPLHGVGKNIFLDAAHEEGFHNIVVVAEQADPDGDFTTVEFPNPEEANTLDLAHRLASQEQCDMTLANDPDADRLQASFPDEKSGEMQKLSGNEMGAIFGYFSLLRATERGIVPVVASSIVSSRMLKEMCRQFDAHYVDGLTGFSNIVQAAVAAESASQSETHPAREFIFAYEEAIGFLIGRVVLDKDGVNAGVRFLEIMNYLKANKKTVWELLDELYLKFGVFVNSSWSWRFFGPEAISLMTNFMDELRAVSTSTIASLLDQSECEKYDLLQPQENNFYEGLRSNVVIFEIENGGRIIVRPSGTEPKIKFYVELSDHATDRQMLSMKKTNLAEKIVQLRSDLARLFGKEA